MITNIPPIPQLTNDNSKDVKLLHEYITRLVQTLTESPAFASDASVAQDDVSNIGMIMFEPEQPLDPFMIQGQQGPQGIQGIQGPPGYDAEEAEVPLPIPGLRGPEGQQGPPGSSALAVSLDSFSNDFEVPLMIPGPAGIQGIPGNNGIPGIDGEDGNDILMIINAATTII